MTSTRLLYELQELDWEIERTQERLASVEARLKDDRAVVEARAHLAEREARLQELQGQHRTWDGQVREFAEKISALENRLYGGTVTNPRELRGMEAELRLVKEHAAEAESSLLEVMVSLDEEEEGAAKARMDLSELETTWSQTQATLTQEREALRTSLVSLQASRGELAARFGPGELSLYDALWRSRQGHPVARAERGMCQGCRLTLPSKELLVLRRAREPVQCNSCGRILHLG